MWPSIIYGIAGQEISVAGQKLKIPGSGQSVAVVFGKDGRLKVPGEGATNANAEKSGTGSSGAGKLEKPGAEPGKEEGTGNAAAPSGSSPASGGSTVPFLLSPWAKDVLQASLDSGLEFAGKLYKNSDGTWSYSPSTAGSEGQSRPQTGEQWVSSHGGTESYDVHSHGSYNGLDANGVRSVNEFSPTDASKSENIFNPKTQFIVTPDGNIKQYMPTFTTNSMGLNGLTVIIGNANDSLAVVEPQF